MQEKFYGIYDHVAKEYVKIKQSNGTYKSFWKTADGAVTALFNDIHKSGVKKSTVQKIIAQDFTDGKLEIISFVVVPETEYNEMKQRADAMKMIRDMMEAAKRARDEERPWERPLPQPPPMPPPPSIPYPNPYPDCPPWQPDPYTKPHPGPWYTPIICHLKVEE